MHSRPRFSAEDLLARLHVTKRSIPAWMAARNMEGEIAVAAFSIDGSELAA